MADRRGVRNRSRSRSRSPVKRNNDKEGIQDRLKRISGVNNDYPAENGVGDELKIDREKVPIDFFFCAAFFVLFSSVSFKPDFVFIFFC